MFDFKLTSLVLLFAFQFSFANPPSPIDVSKSHDGFAFFGALGFTNAFVISDKGENEGAIGPSISTAVSYCEAQVYCIEFGSVVNVNFYDDIKGDSELSGDLDIDLIMWQSSFYLGTRNKFPIVIPTDTWNPWYKVFLGYGSSVGFIRDVNTSKSKIPDGLRFHSEGPILGLGLVFNFNAFNSKKFWFIEITQLIQIQRTNYLVQQTTELPLIIDSFNSRNNSHISQTNLNIGIRFF